MYDGKCLNMREDISNRFLEFAAKIIELGRFLNKTFEGRHIYGQLFRSGTSSGANYEESHSAQSTKDFIHKREICLKELRESLFWLKLIARSKLVPSDNDILMFLLNENQELINIIAKSLTTTKSKMTK
ncbi:MAG TPA: four helix bundle protein [Tenuifilaceae bacterium]|jgi:four helix bundle protein|nr:four helix bundle protein [Tenuifilaceae bacterium]HPJ46925.1 four helix bundle protein [Tenuifilaceae bacterium]HRX69223.1 four helix bundle protein [Tenuifilaceae bacterium]